MASDQTLMELIKNKIPLKRIQNFDEEQFKKKFKKYAPLYTWKIIRFFLLLGIGFILIYPVLYMFTNSIRDIVDIDDPSVIWIPKNFTFDNYKAAFDALHFTKALTTTLLIGVVSALLQVFSTSFIGYGFARFKFRGKNILLLLVILSILVPPQITAVPTSLNYTNINILGLNKLLEKALEGLLAIVGITKDFDFVNILNTPLTFYLPALLGTGIRGGLFIFIFTQFYRNMPKDLEEAAMVDGCKPLQTYFKIMMPNAIVMFITVGLFSLVWYWNDYFYSAVFYTENRPLSVELTLLRNNLQETGWTQNYMIDPNQIRNFLQAGALTVIGPIMLVYILFQKYFIESIDRTGIVG